MGNLGAFKGWACRAAGAEHAVTVAQQNLAVGADVEDQPILILRIGRFRNQHAHIIGADMAGFTGRDVDIGAGGNL